MEAKNAAKIENELAKYHPQKFITKLSINFPLISVLGNRKAYTVEPAIDVSFLYCISEKEENNLKIWLGLRSANFTGSGIQDGIAGRYNFLFLGPAFAIGKSQESLKPDPIDKTSAGKKEDFVVKAKKYSKQEGWLVLGGFGVKQVGGTTDKSHGHINNDFNANLRPFFKGFGSFIELNYVQLFYDAFSVHYNVGIQQSQNHYFYWIGLGVGGWY